MVREPGATAGGGRPAVLTLYSPVAAVLRDAPLTAPLGASVRDALASMARARRTAIVVVEPTRGAPVGVFTFEDLVHRVTLPGGDLDQPVAAVMTGGPVTVSSRTSAHQVALTMALAGVRHVVVVDDAGRLVGLLAHDDLVGLQRIGVDEISARIRAARDPGALHTAAGTIHELADDLLAQGVGAEALGQRIAVLNDLLTIRAIELAADAQEPPGVGFCWLAFGSEGRLEQTFATDQDNGLLFDAEGADVEETRRALLPFARAVNDTLEACGFPRCKGGIMAGNPRWCLSLEEWSRRFGDWIGRPEPEALLNATIFFDLRPVYGRTALADQLQAWLFDEIARRPLFLTLMAQNALRCEPPLGVLRDFSFDHSKEFPGMLDLKAFGSRVFVDAARILSLARGVRHTNTAERLRSVAAEGALGPGTVAATIDALHFIHLLRLRNQRRPGVPPEGANRVDPRSLNELDRAMLKESFKQARRLQDRLRLDYRLEAWG